MIKQVWLQENWTLLRRMALQPSSSLPLQAKFLLVRLVDISVRFQLSGNTQAGPWNVNQIGIYDHDWTLDDTIREIPDSNLGSMTNQNTWYTYTFEDVRRAIGMIALMGPASN